MRDTAINIHRRLQGNILALGTSNVVGAGLSFILSALIGRALGESGLGVYAAALAWVFPVSLLVEFGLGTLITRDIAQQPQDADAYLQAAVMQRVVVGTLLLMMFMAAAPLLSDDPAVRHGIVISAPLVIVNPLYGTFTALLRAHQQMRPIAVMNITMLVAQVLLTGAVFAGGGGVIAALAVNTLTSTGQLAVAWRWTTRALVLESGRKGNSYRLLLAIIRRSWPFAVAAVLSAIQARAGFVLLETLAGTDAVGRYAAATRVIDGLRTLPNALFGALLPALTALAAQPDLMRRLFRRMLAALAVYGWLCALLLMAVAGPLLVLIYGADFAAGASVLTVAGWALLASLLRGGLTLYLYAQGREGRANGVMALALPPYLALNLGLIPSYGATGAALALLIGDGIACVLLVRALWRVADETNRPHHAG